MNTAKAKLRKQFRAIRSHIAISYREVAACNAAAIFVNQSFFKKSNRIACYLAAKNEFEQNYQNTIELPLRRYHFCFIIMGYILADTQAVQKDLPT